MQYIIYHAVPFALKRTHEIRNIGQKLILWNFRWYYRPRGTAASSATEFFCLERATRWFWQAVCPPAPFFVQSHNEENVKEPVRDCVRWRFLWKSSSGWHFFISVVTKKKGGGSIKKTTWDFDVLLVIRLGLNINYFCPDQVGVGRSTRELRPDTNNAVFDSRVLSKHQVATFQVSVAFLRLNIHLFYNETSFRQHWSSTAASSSYATLEAAMAASSTTSDWASPANRVLQRKSTPKTFSGRVHTLL